MSFDTADLVRHFAVALPALLISFTVHEFAHAWVATRLGDPTPKQQGRLTLSPLSHLDPVGSLLIPGISLLFSGSVFFGWANPVQFNPVRFTRKLSMRQGTALTALAGPVSNIILAILCAFGLRWIGLDMTGQRSYARDFVNQMLLLNIGLAAFNLLPIPPMDGSHLLPASMDRVKAYLRGNLFLVFLIIFMPLPGLRMSLGQFLVSYTRAGIELLVFWITG